MDWETARSEASEKDQVQTTLPVAYPSPITTLQDQRRDQAPSGSMVRRMENTRTKEDRHDHHLGNKIKEERTRRKLVAPYSHIHNAWPINIHTNAKFASRKRRRELKPRKEKGK
ncbi:hypothetical protein H112_00796 [Trichophyton rubrum D6]|uniref:Uncharacterized protein n=1 Tax=Trichophyton rubrum CBS 288.86 TaxID=1215330 RepID=A0A022WEY4_TRIRU|nr:hypothetical protein H100_00795 [Trichophyton rubrum MR850]EZF46308.1 hypothetical protein H102_00786 [Trichophyton rubrum CBS 100081]EZF56879.1 hypothetical protein H103_00794 [Trichophyton rubrum CBS 288.86]EZF67510.1 hypothetical protein H104_00779 [Trichophyton rubrum CBS 289.86]EZF88830.1 hypothetical protein H110_00795 [Trichophyton rubrum MR1448]EZF99592.1 hypothetical protein H113_00796 [Trichophyton rubrum MR1459]EZG10527.1 hypothetical protein H106_00590 [Trichophyton rubrum CBS 